MRCNSFSVFATTAFSAGKRNVLFFPAVFRCRVERSIYEKKIFLHQKWCRPFFAFDATAFLPKNGYCFLFCFWQSLPDCQIKRGKVYEKEIFIAPEMVQSAFCLCGYGLFCRKAAVLPFFFCYPAELRESCRAREYIIREIIILHSTPQECSPLSAFDATALCVAGKRKSKFFLLPVSFYYDSIENP